MSGSCRRLTYGGEAMPAREAFRLLPLNQRNALIKFLGSL